MKAKSFLYLAGLLFLGALDLQAQSPSIVSTCPGQNELNVMPDREISVVFDTLMDENTINDSTFIVMSRLEGRVHGTTSYDHGTKTAAFTPTGEFIIGDMVQVVLTGAILSVGGIPLNSGYTWSFTIGVLRASEGLFIYDTAYSFGARSKSIIAGKLDNNYGLDLATNNVSVLFNDGNGYFIPDSIYEPAGPSKMVYSADLDNDYDLDLAVASPYNQSDSVLILLNDGNGAFSRHDVHRAGNSPFSMAGADMDCDGDIDLVAAVFFEEKYSIFLNNGDGSFAAPIFYETGAGPAWQIYAADLNNDGAIDLALATEEIAIFFNNGDATFSGPMLYPAAGDPNYVYSSDLNGDGSMDLIAADNGSNDILSLIHI